MQEVILLFRNKVNFCRILTELILKSEPLYSWVVDHYEPDEDYKQKYWRPNATSEDFEQKTLPAYGVHADTEITAR